MLFAVQSLNKLSNLHRPEKEWPIPMSYVLLMHKLYTLAVIQYRHGWDVRCMNFCHLAYLGKEGDKLAKGLESRTIERAQKREHHQLWRPRGFQFHDV